MNISRVSSGENLVARYALAWDAFRVPLSTSRLAREVSATKAEAKVNAAAAEPSSDICQRDGRRSDTDHKLEKK